MYVPHFNTMEEPGVRGLVAATGSAELITVDADGYPQSTLLPVIWDDDRLILHMARANPHWKAIDPGAKALAVVTGPQAYVSPAWYPSKDEHGRVVPTWNYTAVHFTGRVEVHQDADWLLDAVTHLTTLHEQRRDLLGEQLRVSGGGFNKNVLTMEADSVPASSGRMKGPHAGRDPLTIPPRGTPVVLWTSGPPAETLPSTPPRTPPWRLRSRPPALC